MHKQNKLRDMIHNIMFKKQIPILLFLVFLINACKESVTAPPLSNATTQGTEAIKGTFKLLAPDTLSWKEHPFPGLKNLPSVSFSMDELYTQPFELQSSDSIKGPFIQKQINFDSLETKPLNFNQWPKDSLFFKVKRLGEPITEAVGNLTIDPIASQGVSKIAQNFGIETTIFGMSKDSDNMLWFATRNTIVRYDGNNLITYGLEQGLSIENSYSIFEDSSGILWIGDQNSITAIDFDKQLIYELETKFKIRRVLNIKEDDEGRIWISNFGVGYLVIDMKQQEIHKFTTEQGLISDWGVDVTQDTENTLWLPSRNGINILDFKNNTNTIINGEALLNTMRWPHYVKRKNGTYWIVDRNGIHILSADRKTITYVTKENFGEHFYELTKIAEAKDGTLWIGNESGYMHAVNWEDKSFSTYNLHSGSKKTVYKIVFDNSDQLWATLLDGGTYVLDLKGNQPAIITPEKGLSNMEVWATLQANDGKKWVGTYDKINIIDLKNKKLKYLSTNEGLIDNRNTSLLQDSKGRIWMCGNSEGVSVVNENETTVFQIGSKNFFEGENITYMAEIEDNNFILTASSGRIFNLDLNRNVLRSSQYLEANNDSYISKIIVDNTSDVWFCTNRKGIFKIDAKLNQIQKVETQNIIDSEGVFSLLLDRNSIWVASRQGVNRFDLNTTNTYTYTTKQGMPSNVVWDLSKNNQTIYAGTENGLAILRPADNEQSENKTYTIATIGKQQGLIYPDFSQNSLSVDENGRIWAGVYGQDNVALAVIDNMTNTENTIETAIMGLRIYDDKITFQPSDKIKSDIKVDTIWSADNLSFKTNTEYTDKINQKTANFTYNSTYGKYQLPKDLELSPNQNFLTFAYGAFEFRDQDKISYTYYLEGIDKNWSQSTNQTSTDTYRDLPPGDYTFMVAAKTTTSAWGEPAEFSFTILPHWWQTWWAHTLFLFLGVVIIIWVINYRSKWLKRENKLLEEKVSIRTSQLENKMIELKSTQNQLIHSEKMASLGELTAGIAHEIQNPLNFVNNFSEINMELIDELQNEIKDGNHEEVIALSKDIKENQSKINHHGKRADSIVKGMLKHSRNTSGDKEPTNINAIADEYLRLAYHGLRAKDKTFNATLNTDFDASIGKINVVGQDIGRVILNLITNALHAITPNAKIAHNKSGKTPTIWVSTEKVGDCVMIKVKDNGSGIPKDIVGKIFQPFFTTKASGQGTGLGLSMSYDIIKSHGGDLTVKSTEGEGTEFCIQLPNQ